MSKIEYKRFFPNLFTFASLACGFLAVIEGSKEQYDNVIFACYLIILASVFDMMDGIMARLTNTSSKFGIELDSLADVVSFGFVPAFLAYRLMLNNYGILGFLVASAFLFAGAFRLARFNASLTGFSKSSFTGLPIPAAAITLAAYIITGLQEAPFITKIDPFNPYFSVAFIPVILLLSLLMVSKISYPVAPKPSPALFKQNPMVFLVLIVGLVLAFITQGKSIFYFMIIFVLQGPTLFLIKHFGKNGEVVNSTHSTQ